MAVDETEAIVGGDEKLPVYLGENPIHDLSMHVRGGVIVASLHTFANRLWRVTAHLSPPPEYVVPAVLPAPGNVSVFSVGRHPDSGEQPSETALYAMMDAASSTIRISQQDIVSTYGEPDTALVHLVAALARGVDIYIVTSNAGAQGNWGMYDPPAFRDALDRHASLFPPETTGADFDALLCSKLHLTSIRFSTEDMLSSPIPDHAKFMMVDDKVFYIGSHNIYPSAVSAVGGDYSLNEMGLIVDNASAASHVLLRYWTPLWERSKRVVVFGPELASCAPAVPTPLRVEYFTSTFSNKPGYFSYLGEPKFVFRVEPTTTGGTYDIEYKAGSRTTPFTAYCPLRADRTCTDSEIYYLPSLSTGAASWRVRRHDSGQPPGAWSAWSAFTPSLGSSAGIYGPFQGSSLKLGWLVNFTFMVPPSWETTYATFQPYVKWKDSGGKWCQKRITWRPQSSYANGWFTTADGQFHVYQVVADSPGVYPNPAFSCGAGLRAGAVTMQFGIGPAGCHDAGECQPASGAPSLNITFNNQL